MSEPLHLITHDGDTVTLYLDLAMVCSSDGRELTVRLTPGVATMLAAGLQEAALAVYRDPAYWADQDD